MADATDGPLRGWYDIHQALRVELADLREHAKDHKRELGNICDVHRQLVEARVPELTNA
jgi:hypothetical protein